MPKLITPPSEPERDSRSGEQAEEAYVRLKQAGLDATRHGRFEEALDAYTRARELAAGGAAGLLDEADLNVAMVLIQMGEARKGEEGLREILLRARDPRVGVAAAYNLASSLRKQGRHERAMTYAKRALERASSYGSTDCLAMVHNLMGNLHLAQSYLDDALAEYERALALRNAQEGDTRYSRAIVLENLGYCLLLKQELRPGIVRLREALDLARQVGDRRCEAECLQDLCYGLLLTGEHDDAVDAGISALGVATETGYDDIEENCHYLLGELGSRMGDLAKRDDHFQRLQSLHPELPFLKDFLCAVDVTQIITLKR